MDGLPTFLRSEEGQFHGSKKFYEYLEEGRLRPGQGFRAYNYACGSGDEPRFCLGLEGKLYDQGQKEVDPKKVLNNQDGWEFNYICLDCLPQEVIFSLPR